MFMRILVLVIGSVISVLMLKYRAYVRDFTGEIGFAERYLGPGGTNILLIFISILVFILSLMYAFGTLQSMIVNLSGRFFGF